MSQRRMYPYCGYSVSAMTRAPALSTGLHRLRPVSFFLILAVKAVSAAAVRCLLVMALVLLCSEAVPAQQSIITGNYGPFSVTTLKAAIAPPPGTVVLENGSIFYITREFVDSDGNKTTTGTSNVFVNRTTFGYVVPDFQILGADFYPAIFVILSDQTIRPDPGSERALQLSDTIVQPVALGWHTGEWHALFSYNLWLPTGRFDAGAANNTGKGLFSHMLTAGVTWLQESPLPWIGTLQLRYEIPGEQKTTGIRPGQVMTFEFGAGKEVFEGFDLGVSGAFSFQTTHETGSAPGTDTSLYRYAGVGPEVFWRPASLPGAQLSFRSFFEFGARNTSEGTGLLFSFAYLF